jgi:hypothetical protein
MTEAEFEARLAACRNPNWVGVLLETVGKMTCYDHYPSAANGWNETLAEIDVRNVLRALGWEGWDL